MTDNKWTVGSQIIAGVISIVRATIEEGRAVKYAVKVHERLAVVEEKVQKLERERRND